MNSSHSAIPASHPKVATAVRPFAPDRPKWVQIILRIVGYLLRYGLPTACSVLLVLWLFRKVDFSRMIGIIRHGVNYWWIIAMMVITVFSHIIRGYRWGLQLEAAGIHAPIGVRCVAVFGNYSLNLIIPKLGEVWRPLYISKISKAPFSKVFGTLIGDRACDGCTVLCLIGLTFIVTSADIHAFMTRYSVGQDVLDMVRNPILWCSLVVVLGIIWSAFHFFGKLRWINKVEGSLKRFWTGFKALGKMRHKGRFVAYTFGIWICYYLEVYICFYAFPFTDRLVHEPGMAFGLLPGLVAFVFSTISMAIPSNGGLGPWNLAIIFGLTLFGVERTEATAFSMLVWAAQSLTLVMLGIYAVTYIMGNGGASQSYYVAKHA